MHQEINWVFRVWGQGFRLPIFLKLSVDYEFRVKYLGVLPQGLLKLLELPSDYAGLRV